MTAMRIVDCEDLPATQRLGRCLGAALRTGDVLALVGSLGSGKTTLTKSIAAGAGVADPRQVNSPTFVIVNEYEAPQAREPLHIYHIDVYRLGGGGDLEAIGFDEMCRDGAAIVEWADRVAEAMPADALTITIVPTGDERRQLSCSAGGPNALRLLSALPD